MVVGENDVGSKFVQCLCKRVLIRGVLRHKSQTRAAQMPLDQLGVALDIFEVQDSESFGLAHGVSIKPGSAETLLKQVDVQDGKPSTIKCLL